MDIYLKLIKANLIKDDCHHQPNLGTTQMPLSLVSFTSINLVVVVAEHDP